MADGACHKHPGPSLNGHPLTNSGTAGAPKRRKKVEYYKSYSDAQKKTGREGNFTEKPQLITILQPLIYRITDSGKDRSSMDATERWLLEETSQSQ